MCSGVLWPEAEEERARQSLSQAIYSLKRDFGIDVAASGARLRLDGKQLSSDVADFKSAVAAKNWREAAALYTGPFLDGFYPRPIETRFETTVAGTNTAWKHRLETTPGNTAVKPRLDTTFDERRAVHQAQFDSAFFQAAFPNGVSRRCFQA